MYRKEIEEYIDSHKDQMIEDICTLCRINSEKMPYTEGKPFGEGPFEVLQTALTMMENYGFSVRNYDNYVGTADLNDKEAQLDILAHLDVVPAGEGWTVTEPFEPVIKDGKLYGRGTADATKFRSALTKEDLAQLHEYLKETNKHFLLACQMEYIPLSVRTS